MWFRSDSSEFVLPFTHTDAEKHSLLLCKVINTIDIFGCLKRQAPHLRESAAFSSSSFSQFVWCVNFFCAKWLLLFSNNFVILKMCISFKRECRFRQLLVFVVSVLQCDLVIFASKNTFCAGESAVLFFVLF